MSILPPLAVRLNGARLSFQGARRPGTDRSQTQIPRLMSCGLIVPNRLVEGDVERSQFLQVE